MILPNLIPSEGPIDFKSAYDTKSHLLHITFRDPATWCQSHSIALKCKNSQSAVRWLYRALGARFTGDGLNRLWSGKSALGSADGSRVVPMSLVVASETLLTEDVYTIWFTGAYQPFITRQYSLELLQAKLPKSTPPSPLLQAIEDSFIKVSFPDSSNTEWALLDAEYELSRSFPLEPSATVNRLAQLFITAKLGDEEAIVKQLCQLEQTVLKVLDRRASR